MVLSFFQGVGLILFVLTITIGRTRAQNEVPAGEKVTTLLASMNGLHLNPKPLNAKFSNEIYNQLIKRIDPSGLILTRKSLEGISIYKDSLCVPNKNLITTFVDSLSANYSHQLGVANSLIDSCFSQGFSFCIPDSIVFQKEELPTLAKDEAEHRDRWRKYLKYEILNSLVISQPDSVLINLAVSDSLIGRNSEIWLKIAEREKRRLQFLEKYDGGIPGYILESLLGTITSCYDPHSVYFSKHDKEDFESSLTKENYAFGFSLDQNLNKEVVIKEIAPESPAWLSKELEEGDILINVKMGEQELELAFSDLEEVDRLFAISKENKVELAVKKPNGEVKSVILLKGKVDTKESMSYSCLLNGVHKIGYLSFSQFYTEFGRMGINGSSTDFLRDLVKLQEDGIEGLVIDLRNNPGGSEYEAMKIAGFLLGKGALAIHTDKDGIQTVLANEEAEKWFSGPIVVLINGGSASASELLSAALQDYNRAILIGTNSYGKASAQNILPIGRKLVRSYEMANRIPNEYGFVKVTRAKLNRMTGLSYQKYGVVPDIRVQDGFSKVISTEKDMPFALEQDTIVPEFSYNPLPELPVDSLLKLSIERQMKDTAIQNIIKLEESFVRMQNEKYVSLRMEDFIQMSRDRNQLVKLYQDTQAINNLPFTTENNSYDLEKYSNDPEWQRINERFKSFLTKDATVSEAYNVIGDMIK